MSIEDLKPEGFTEHMLTYANFVKPWSMYVQGFALREVAVWLRVAGTETMLGFGEPDAALAEAEARLEAMLVKVRRQIADRKTPIALGTDASARASTKPPVSPTTRLCRDCADFGPICPNNGKPCSSKGV